MNRPFISYLVTCHNEGNQLKDLLLVLERYIDGNEVVILDDFSDDKITIDVLNEYKSKSGFVVIQHALNNNYGEHKNEAIKYATGKYCFAIDADEIPHEFLLSNLNDILNSNENIELFWIARINNFSGVTIEIAKQWGWNIDNPNKWINWHNGDYQGRIFLRDYPRIQWTRRLHEKITGNKTHAYLPKEESYALHHHKTIEKQIQTNLRYNKLFTQQENMGI